MRNNLAPVKLSSSHLATLFEIVADVAGERPAIIQGDVRRSWRELDDRAARLAGYLADAGGIG